MDSSTILRLQIVNNDLFNETYRCLNLFVYGNIVFRSYLKYCAKVINFHVSNISVNLFYVDFILLFGCLKNAVMGLIRIEGMEFYAFHGHYLKKGGRQQFCYRSGNETDLSLPSKTDNLDDAVDYQAYKIVASEMEKSRLYWRTSQAGY